MKIKRWVGSYAEFESLDRDPNGMGKEDRCFEMLSDGDNWRQTSRQL